jgi:hypothetical protein
MPATDLALQHREFQLPRRGHAFDECEDASAAAPDRGRFAVADGAAESFQGGLWARLLVDDFVRGDEAHTDWGKWLPPLQARWAAEVGRRSAQGDRAGPALPWYLEARLQQQGAFATFLGLTVESSNWQALAVGDSCLFHVRAGRLLLAFPLTRAADFTSHPWLVGSRTSPAEVPRKQGVRLQGDWRGGDRLLLMTDALAHWFLDDKEAGGKPWQALEGLLSGPEEAFADWVALQRGAGRLRNDDVTLLAVCL